MTTQNEKISSPCQNLFLNITTFIFFQDSKENIFIHTDINNIIRSLQYFDLYCGHINYLTSNTRMHEPFKLMNHI